MRIDYSVSPGTLTTLIGDTLAMIKLGGKKRDTYLRVQQDIFWFQIPGNTRTLNLLAFFDMFSARNNSSEKHYTEHYTGKPSTMNYG